MADSLTDWSLRPRYWCFGPYVVDRLRNHLSKDGVLVAIRPKDLELLLVLVEQHGRIVEKEELLARVWPGIIVEEGNLARHISTLRKTLNESTDKRAYIVTLPTRGYRFVADVVAADAPPDTRQNERDGHAGSEPASHQPSRSIRHMVSLATAATIAFTFWLAPDATRAPDAAPPTPRALLQITDDIGVQQHPSWAPDGQHLVYASDHEGTSSLWVQSTVGENALITRLTPSGASDTQPDWSPDGRWIAFRSERDVGGIYVTPAEGGPVRRLAAFGYQPQWSPDARRVLFMSADSGQLGPARPYTVAIGDSAPVAVHERLLSEFGVAYVSWHPDGRISIWGRRAGRSWTFVTADHMGGVVESEIAPAVSDALSMSSLTLSRFAWAPSGTRLYFEGVSHGVRNLWRIHVDPVTLAWNYGPERLTTNAGDEGNVAVSPDGRRIAFGVRTAKTQIWSLSFDHASGQLTGRAEPLTSGRVGEESPSTSVDGARLVYRTARAGQYAFREQTLVDSNDRVLLVHTDDRLPRMSHDGAQLAYLRTPRPTNAPAAATLVTTPVGSMDERVVATFEGNSFVPNDWAPDGSAILGTGRTPTMSRVAVLLLPLAGAPNAERHMRIVARSDTWNLYAARFSPDQQWVAFAANNARRDGTSTIYASRIKGGPWTLVSEDAHFDDKPQWSPDGRTVYFVSNRDGFINVWGRHFDPLRGQTLGRAFRVTTFDSSRRMLSPAMQSLKIAFTDDSLILPITEYSGDLWMLDHVDP